jgi:two-component system KDP operon response regulator KdpE
MSPRTPHLLVIEDEPTLLYVLRATLEYGGFSSDGCESALSALRKLDEFGYDCVIMDLNLPDSDGFELLKAVRARSNVPVVVVSGRGTEHDRVNALDEGADDFVQKPFMPAELLARVRAVLRRHGAADAAQEAGRTATPAPAAASVADGRFPDLTASERRLFAILQSSSSEVVPTPAIVAAVWGEGLSRDAHHVRVLVTNLRKKLNRADDPLTIENDRGIGYRLVRHFSAH